MYQSASKPSYRSRPSQQDAWDQLTARHKNVLKAIINVQIYNRKDNSKFLSSMMTINPENPTTLTYCYTNQKQNVFTIDILRLHRKNGFIWNEEALMSIKNDKKIGTAIKAKLRSDIIMLIKEDDTMETFIVFASKEEMAEWTTSLKFYLSQFKDQEIARGSSVKGSHQRTSSNLALRPQMRNPHRGKSHTLKLDLESFIKQSKVIERITEEMKLYRIILEEGEGDQPFKFKLHLSAGHRDDWRVFTLDVSLRNFRANPKQVIVGILSDIKPLAPLDKEIICEYIQNTMEYQLFAEKAKDVQLKLEESYHSSSSPRRNHNEKLKQVSKQLKKLQTDSNVKAEAPATDLHEKLFYMINSAKLGYVIENYETLAELQELNSAKYINTQVSIQDDDEEPVEEDNIKRLKRMHEKESSTNEKRLFDCSTICNIF